MLNVVKFWNNIDLSGTGGGGGAEKLIFYFVSAVLSKIVAC